jgi:hypothetical protein
VPRCHRKGSLGSTFGGCESRSVLGRVVWRLTLIYARARRILTGKMRLFQVACQLRALCVVSSGASREACRRGRFHEGRPGPMGRPSSFQTPLAASIRAIHAATWVSTKCS